jgi:hypothetical protein
MKKAFIVIIKDYWRFRKGAAFVAKDADIAYIYKNIPIPKEYAKLLVELPPDKVEPNTTLWALFKTIRKQERL